MKESQAECDLAVVHTIVQTLHRDGKQRSTASLFLLPTHSTKVGLSHSFGSWWSEDERRHGFAEPLVFHRCGSAISLPRTERTRCFRKGAEHEYLEDFTLGIPKRRGDYLTSRRISWNEIGHADNEEARGCGC